VSTPIQEGRWEQALRRWFGIKTRLDMSALPDVTPTVLLSGDRAEDAFNREEQLFSRGFSAVASPGNFGQVYLEAPGSADNGQTYGVIEGIDFVQGASPFLGTLPAIFIGLGAGQAIARDTRRNFRPFVASGQQPCRLNPGIRFTAIAELAPVSTVLQVAGITTSQQWFRPCVPFIIAPGSRFVIETSVVASALQVNLHWREVTMLPQSL